MGGAKIRFRKIQLGIHSFQLLLRLGDIMFNKNDFTFTICVGSCLVHQLDEGIKIATPHKPMVE